MSPQANRRPVIMHINYCEQGQTIPQACVKAAAWGFDGIELRGKRAGVQETPEQYLDMVARATEEAGLRHVVLAIMPMDLMKPECPDRAAVVQEWVRFLGLARERLKERFTVANAFTGPLINPDKSVPDRAFERHGSGCATPEQWAWAVEAFQTLGREAQRLGVRLAFETHMQYLHDTPQATRELLSRINSPAVGANLDYGNQVYFAAPTPLPETIALLKDRLHYVHLKNGRSVAGARFPVGLGEGDINHRQFLTLLAQAGYAGPICIEGPRPGDREWFAREDLAYFKSLLADFPA